MQWTSLLLAYVYTTFDEVIMNNLMERCDDFCVDIWNLCINLQNL